MPKDYEKKAYQVIQGEDHTEVRISDEVVAVIAGLAATEVEGVANMSGDLTREIINKLGMNSLAKGIALQVEDQVVTVTVSLTIKYGYSVPEVSAKVQEKVKNAIENRNE